MQTLRLFPSRQVLRTCLCVVVLAAMCPQAHAAGEPPAIRAAIDKAMDHLRKNLQDQAGGFASIGALGLLKGGEPPTSPVLQQVVREIYGKINTSAGYRPKSSGIYEAGVDLMVLANHDAEQHRVQIQAVLDYLLAKQYPGGEWNYEGEMDGGDTSMVQYAMLGLWAAQRSGLQVPQENVERAARWLLKSQKPSGGFGYHPYSTSNVHPSEETPSMTMAGTAALGICRVMLYPETNPAFQQTKEPPKRKFGVLEEVNVEDLPQEQVANGKSAVPVADMTRGIGRGFAWLNQRWTVNTGRWEYYYLYTLERAAALGGFARVGTHDWYAEGAGHLLGRQLEDGSWNGTAGSGKMGGTAFGILFLIKATGKTLGAPDVGGGLLAGGRGLPDDLSELAMKDGEVVKEKKLGPLDELLKELANTKDFDVADVQAAILEKVEISTPEEREALIQQKDLLLRLVDDPRAEVRRTAMWALGRTDDLKVSRPLINVLKKDNNVDVLIEARNALCFLSRRPRGFGEPESPFYSLAEDADQAARDQALAEWRATVLEKWGEWYRSVQPYEQRDELESFGL